MKFTKNKGMSLAAVLIVLAVFNALAFLIPFQRAGGFWVGYGFATLAILLAAGVGLYALGHEGMKSKFYGLPIAMVATAYMAAQVVLSLVEMAVPVLPARYGILINVILLAACLIGLIGAGMGKEEIARIDAKVKEKVFYIKSLQGDIEGMAQRAQGEPLKKALTDLAETVRFSDPMSSPQLAAIENKIEAKAGALEESLSDPDASMALCQELQMLFAERNRKCKLLK